MGGTRISALTAANSMTSADQLPIVQSGINKVATAALLRLLIGEGLSGASPAQATGFAADTYLAGSAIPLPFTGTFAVGTILRWQFDMAKTAAGVATPIITVRAGTLGAIGDASIYTFTFGAGTAAADTGIFDIVLVFRTVGSGTSAVVAGIARCTHHLAATGLTATGASGTGIITPGASAGFDSTTQSFIGLSFNGGASFSGTNTVATGDADKL